MSEILPKKSLVAKLAEACNAVGGVAKKGHNDRQNYDFVRAADVAKAIRRELFKRGIILLADHKAVSETEVKTISGGTLRYLTLTVEYTLLDGDSSERIVSTAYGIAMDSGDKALYKAQTAAQKYYLRNLGLIPDEKDDLEADESVDEATSQATAKFTKHEKLADAQIRAWNIATGKNGKTEGQKTLYLRRRWNRESVGDLSKDEFATAIRWACGSTEEEFAASLEFINGKKRKGAQPIVEAAEATRSDEAGD